MMLSVYFFLFIDEIINYIYYTHSLLPFFIIPLTLVSLSYHSTKNALVYINNDLHLTKSTVELSSLIFLDPAAAYDTVFL